MIFWGFVIIIVSIVTFWLVIKSDGNSEPLRFLGSVAFAGFILGVVLIISSITTSSDEENARTHAKNMGYSVREVCTKTIAYRTSAQKVIVEKDGKIDQIWFQNGEQLYNYRRGLNNCE